MSFTVPPTTFSTFALMILIICLRSDTVATIVDFAPEARIGSRFTCMNEDRQLLAISNHVKEHNQPALRLYGGNVDTLSSFKMNMNATLALIKEYVDLPKIGICILDCCIAHSVSIVTYNRFNFFPFTCRLHSDLFARFFPDPNAVRAGHRTPAGPSAVLHLFRGARACVRSCGRGCAMRSPTPQQPPTHGAPVEPARPKPTPLAAPARPKHGAGCPAWASGTAMAFQQLGGTRHGKGGGVLLHAMPPSRPRDARTTDGRRPRPARPPARARSGRWAAISQTPDAAGCPGGR